MSVLDKFMNVFGADDEDEDYEEVEEVITNQPNLSSAPKIDFSQLQSNVGKEKMDNYSTPSFGTANSQFEVVLVKPEHFSDASGIADSLNAKKTVVLNLENTSKENAKRLVDFLSGVAYANKGQLKQIANSTFIITPNNVDVSGVSLLSDIDMSTEQY